MPWYYYQDPETCTGPFPSRDEAIAEGRERYDSDFFVAEGSPFKLSADIRWDAWLPERFDDHNEEWLGEDFQKGAERWERSHENELYAALSATFGEWLKRHGYDEGWALDLQPHEAIANPAPWDERPIGLRPGTGLRAEPASPVTREARQAPKLPDHSQSNTPTQGGRDG